MKNRKEKCDVNTWYRGRYINKRLVKNALALVVALISVLTAGAQTTVVRGVVKDEKSKETLPFVSIQVEGTKSGGISDDEGKFAITLPAGHTTLVFTYIGYMPQRVTVTEGISQTIDVKMNVDVSLLQEVVIKGKLRYRNRNNPAVELIRKVIDNRDKNRVLKNDYVEYEQYEKMSLAISNLSDKFVERGIFRKYQFLFENEDSTGKHQLPAYLQEQVSQVYFRRNPYKFKQIVKAERKAEYDPRFIDNDGLNSYLNRLYEDLDIYDNNISIATNMFLSPVASTAPTFYKFFIRDTVKTHDPQLIELGFVPRNKADMLFEGKIYVTLDGNYAVQYAYLTVNKSINVNFMRGLEAKLEYARMEDGRYRPDQTDLSMEFALTDKGAGLSGKRTISYKNYVANSARADSVYDGPSKVYLPKSGSGAVNEDYWVESRHIPLARTERNIYRNVDTLQTIPSFKRSLDLITIFLAGYKSFGPVEVGPINTFYSFNPVEGFRLRLGGRTTPQFNKRLYFETYAAYGFKDEKWKYFFSGTYSLNNKSVYHFPLHYMRLSYQRDTKIPGQELQFVQEDNFLLSFKRGENNRFLYNDIYKFEYVREFQNRFSYRLGLTQWAQRPAGVLEYVTNSVENPVKLDVLNNTEASLELRYAPKEQFYQGKVYRTPIVNSYPIYSIRYSAGMKGLLEGDYKYHNVTANIFKRVYLSQFGYADVTLEGGYIFGKNIPYPLLTIHRANQTYAYQLNSYNLMNFLEFASDHYASVDVQYYLNGFVFNKIPLFKKLKWREVLSAKVLQGGLRDENNPANRNADVLAFSTDADGRPVTYSLGRAPYAEVSAGVANIFKLVRIDLVKRLTYLDNPNVAPWGVRIRFRLDF